MTTWSFASSPWLILLGAAVWAGAAWLCWQNARDSVEKNFGWPSINAVFERYCRETVAVQRRA